MTTRDGIGAPRHREVVERDKRAMELIRERSERGLCTRLGDLRKEFGPELTRGQVFYVIQRLKTAGLIERRAGYLWCIPESAILDPLDGAESSSAASGG